MQLLLFVLLIPNKYNLMRWFSGPLAANPKSDEGDDVDDSDDGNEGELKGKQNGLYFLE